jgi:hydroxymethylbilane synthase
MVASPDGQRMVRADLTGELSDPEALGTRVARWLDRQGAQEILAESLQGSAHAEASS